MSLIEKVREAVADTLNLPISRICESTAADDLVEWDSLGQINIMMAVEQIFDLILDVEDFQDLNSIPAIVGYLEKNGVGV